MSATDAVVKLFYNIGVKIKNEDIEDAFYLQTKRILLLNST